MKAMKTEKHMIYGLLIHLGRNLWGDGNAADHVRCDEKGHHGLAQSRGEYDQRVAVDAFLGHVDLVCPALDGIRDDAWLRDERHRPLRRSRRI